jgi:hypothetical protein
MLFSIVFSALLEELIYFLKLNLPLNFIERGEH